MDLPVSLHTRHRPASEVAAIVVSYTWIEYCKAILKLSESRGPNDSTRGDKCYKCLNITGHILINRLLKTFILKVFHILGRRSFELFLEKLTEYFGIIKSHLVCHLRNRQSTFSEQLNSSFQADRTYKIQR